MKFARAVSVSLISILILAVAPAAADPTYVFQGERTKLTFASEFQNTLRSLGVTVRGTGDADASIVGKSVTLPVVNAALDSKTVEGEAFHTGGMRLSKGGTSLDVGLVSVVIQSSSRIFVSGVIAGNDSVMSRIQLFQLIPTAPRAPLAPSVIGRVELTGTLKLTPAGARALNGAFATAAFLRGATVGTGQVTLTDAKRLKNL